MKSAIFYLFMALLQVGLCQKIVEATSKIEFYNRQSNELLKSLNLNTMSMYQIT